MASYSPNHSSCFPRHRATIWCGDVQYIWDYRLARRRVGCSFDRFVRDLLNPPQLAAASLPQLSNHPEGSNGPAQTRSYTSSFLRSPESRTLPDFEKMPWKMSGIEPHPQTIKYEAQSPQKSLGQVPLRLLRPWLLLMQFLSLAIPAGRG